MSGLQICEEPLNPLRLFGPSHAAAPLLAAACLLGVASGEALADTIAGHLHPLARAEFDRGAVPGDFALRGITLMVRRTAAQQSELERLLQAQQDPASPQYRQWLTPEQFADRFGASPASIARLRKWLEDCGFRIKAVARARTFIRFGATADQVRIAFGAEIHHYFVQGVAHYANAGPPSLPATLAPLVLAVGGLDDFGPHPGYAYSGGSLNALAPADLAAIYDIGGLESPVPDGAGQTVVIVGSSDVTATDLALYCTTFSTDAACGTAFTVAYPEADPGISDADWAAEETMDLELVSAVAPGAALVLDADANVWNAFYDAVDNDRGQVISMSFGVCESLVEASLAAGIQAAAQEANALGITLVASSGDSGGAGCDSGPIAGGGAHGPAVDLPASLPEATAVGGTRFNEGAGAYWSGGTATGYIPEEVWNDTVATGSLAASGGGASALFAKPAWQAGTGVPADGQRDVPDVALAASAIHDGYVIAIGGVLSTAGDSPYAMGGTSASTAVFAAMVALLNESLGSGSGNINAALYAIAAGGSGAAAFHDITTGDNIVPCAGDADGCTSSPPQLGWSAGTGYDLATGLGSVDQYQLLEAWPAGYDAAPAIDTLLPSTAGAGSASQMMTVAGTGFTALSTVTWTFASVTTTLASTCGIATSCSVTVPAPLLIAPGSASIRVVSAGGLDSAPATFTIAGAPTIGSLSPAEAVAGSGSFTLTVTGTNFVGSSAVYWGSTALGTTYGSATSLTAAVTSTQLASAGLQSVTVHNPTGVSSASTFTVDGPAITSLSPTSAVAGATTFTLTVTGTNFAASSAVNWGATPLATTYGSSTSLTATVTSTQLASAGLQNVTVQDTYGVSSASTFSVNAPMIGSLSPAAAMAGGAAFTLTVTGTNYLAGSTVLWGATPLATTYGSATSLTAAVTGTQLASAGPQSVTVQNSSAASSSASSFLVNGPAIASLVPSAAVAGGAALTLTVTGTNFVAGSTVVWGATPLATTYGSATSLTAAVTGTQLDSAGPQNVTIQNSIAASSAASAFTVNGPTIASLSTPSIAAGTTPATTITLTGANFIAVSTDGSGNYLSGSLVYSGTTALAVTAGTSTSITASISPTLVSSTGRLNLTVHNPGGATSSASVLTVVGPTITTLTPNTAVAAGAAFTLTVTGTNFVTNSTVLWGSTALETTHGSATSLTAAVTSIQLASSGPQNVTVENSSMASSSASAFAVNGPAITSLSSTSAFAGSAAFTLTVTGINFVGGSTVLWNTTPLATGFVSATSLTAAVTPVQIAAAGSQNVTVQNSSAASSSASPFAVVGPTIASLSPVSAVAGAAAFTLTVTGTGFVGASTVMWGATALETTYGSATSLTASVTSTQFASAGPQNITVRNSSAASSAANTFTVSGPTIISMNPTSVPAGAAVTTVTVTGANFIAEVTDGSGNYVSGSLVYSGTTALAVTAGTSTSITAILPPTMVAAAGPLSLTVHNPGGATSSASTLTVAGPAIASLSPTSASAGDVAFTLTVTGTNFVSGSTVLWGESALATTYGSATSLTAAVTSAQLASAGSQSVTVKNSSAASSAASDFTVNGPAITALSPTATAAGGAAFTVTVTGINFVGGSAVLWGSTPLTTTLTTPGSTTSLTAAVTSTQLAAAGSARVTVKNSSAASSAASTFAVDGPTISSVSPMPVVAGASAAAITVTGANFIAEVTDGGGNFVSGSLVYCGATALAVTAGTSTSITATLPPTLIASTGALSITVHNPGGAKSSASTLTVAGPTITSLSPTSADAGGAAFTLTVAGTNFVSGSTVMWGATALTTTYGSATSLTAAVTSGQLASAGSPKVTVRNSSGATSSADAFTVTGPTITALSPTSVAAGAAAFTLTVTGIGFVTGSTVLWNSVALETTYGSATSLTAAVTSTQLARTGTPKVTVQNTSAASSPASAFSVNGPTLASLSPSSAAAGSAAFTLTVTGTNFAGGSTVMWGTAALATTYGSATSLTAAVTSAQLASTGSPKVTVKNSSSASSSAIAFTVIGPTLASLSVTSIAAGAAPFTLTLTGTNFVSGSTVMWGTTALATTYGSATSLTAAVTSTQLNPTGSVKVTVKNSSGASSSASTFAVSGPTISSLSPSTIAAASAPFTLTVSGANFVAGSTVMWGSTALATTYGSATSLTAAVTSTQLVSAGSPKVTVKNSSAASSPSSTFTITTH